jgi:phage FluMu gp28-like protein
MKHPRVRRACGDPTGIGLGLVERLQTKFGTAKVEGITFTREIKEDMSVRVRHRMEEKLDKIPANAPAVERAFAAIKREATGSGNLRFDAERSDAGHADEYWAKALADLAADSHIPPAMGGWDPPERVTGDKFGILDRDREDGRRSVWDQDREEVGLGVFQR